VAKKGRVARLSKDEFGGVQCDNGERGGYYPARHLGSILSAMIDAIFFWSRDDGGEIVGYGSSDHGVLPVERDGSVMVAYMEDVDEE
jgi:hypothetical protein